MSTVRSRLKYAATLIAAVATSASLFAAAPSASATPAPSCSTAGIGLAALGGPNFYIDNGSTPQFTSSYTGYTVTNSTGAALSDTWVSLGSFTGGDLALATGQTAAERIASLSNGSARPLFWYLNAPTATSTAQGFSVTVYRHRPGAANATVLCSAAGGFNRVIGTLSASANKVTDIQVSNAAPSLGSTFDVTVTGSTGTMGAGPSDNSDPYALWMSPAVMSAWPPSAFQLESTNLHISADGTAAPTDYPNTLRVANLGSSSRAYTATYTFRAIGFTAGPTTVKPVQEISSGTQVKHTGSYTVALPTIASPSDTVYLDLSATPTKMDVGGGQADYTATVHGPSGVTLDSFVLTPPPGASVVSGSATFDGVSISDPVAQNGKLVFSGPFFLTGADIPLTFTLDLGATSGDRVTSLLAGLGSALIGKDTSDITGAHPATATVNVDTAPTAPDFSISAARNDVTDVDVLSHASDADGDTLTVTAISSAEHGTATLTDGAVTYQPDADRTTPDTFTYTVDDGRGGSAQGTVTVNVQPLATQTITFPDLSAVTVGYTEQAGAGSDSGLPISYTSQTSDVCTVDPDTGLITTIAVGTCTIAADQPGNDTYAPADQATSSFTVNPAVQPQSPQTINAADQDTVNVTAEQVTLSASADSGLPVAFTSETPDVCDVDSSTGVVTLLAAGTCTIAVSQDGNDAYLAATPVDVSFTVDPAAQAITFTPPTQLLTGPDAYVLTATTNAFLPVSFTVTAGNDVCSVSGASLSVNGTGSCDIQASADGSDVYAAATPVTRTIDVVAPADDSVQLPPTTGQSAPQQIDVLANDPDGLTLTDVGTAAHGTVSVDNGRVTYTPEVTFRGVDQFDYTVTDGSGRTASATVTVQVPDAAPTAADATVRQVAGSVVQVNIDATDLNGDALTLTVVGNHPPVPVTVNGLSVRLAPSAAQTGTMTITVAVHDGAGGSAQATIVDTVRPRPVAWARRTISSTGTHITWAKASATGAKYMVRIGSDVACVTAALSCDSPRLLGPAARVSVQVRGGSNTVSTRTAAKPVHGVQVLVGTVYFRPASARLRPGQRAQLVTLAHQLARNGFNHVQLNGYTDLVRSKSHSLHLSQRRTEAIARMLARYGFANSQAWLGMKNPAVPGRNSGKNRRVEILVS